MKPNGKESEPMIDMRKEKRWPAKLELEITSLFKQDNVKVENINAPIHVFDISKAGIGFTSKSILPYRQFHSHKYNPPLFSADG